MWLAVGVAGVLTLASMADARGFRRYMKLQQDMGEMESRNRDLRRQNERLVREIEALRKDRSAVERAAREELGYVRQDEIVVNVE